MAKEVQGVSKTNASARAGAKIAARRAGRKVGPCGHELTRVKLCIFPKTRGRLVWLCEEFQREVSL